MTQKEQWLGYWAQDLGYLTIEKINELRQSETALENYINTELPKEQSDVLNFLFIKHCLLKEGIQEGHISEAQSDKLMNDQLLHIKKGGQPFFQSIQDNLLSLHFLRETAEDLVIQGSFSEQDKGFLQKFLQQPVVQAEPNVCNSYVDEDLQELQEFAADITLLQSEDGTLLAGMDLPPLPDNFIDENVESQEISEKETGLTNENSAFEVEKDDVAISASVEDADEMSIKEVAETIDMAADATLIDSNPDSFEDGVQTLLTVDESPELISGGETLLDSPDEFQSPLEQKKDQLDIEHFTGLDSLTDADDALLETLEEDNADADYLLNAIEKNAEQTKSAEHIAITDNTLAVSDDQQQFIVSEKTPDMNDINQLPSIEDPEKAIETEIAEDLPTVPTLVGEPADPQINEQLPIVENMHNENVQQMEDISVEELGLDINIPLSPDATKENTEQDDIAIEEQDLIDAEIDDIAIEEQGLIDAEQDDIAIEEQEIIDTEIDEEDLLDDEDVNEIATDKISGAYQKDSDLFAASKEPDVNNNGSPRRGAPWFLFILLLVLAVGYYIWQDLEIQRQRQLRIQQKTENLYNEQLDILAQLKVSISSIKIGEIKDLSPYLQQRQRVEKILFLSKQMQKTKALKQNIQQLTIQLQKLQFIIALYFVRNGNYLAASYELKNMSDEYYKKIEDTHLQILLEKLESLANSTTEKEVQYCANTISNLQQQYLELVKNSHCNKLYQRLWPSHKNDAQARAILYALSAHAENYSDGPIIDWAVAYLRDISIERSLDVAENIIYALSRLKASSAKLAIYKKRQDARVAQISPTFLKNTKIYYRQIPMPDLNPQTIEQWFQFAEMHYEQGQLHKAIKGYQHCLELHKSFALAYFKQASAYARLASSTKNIDYWKKSFRNYYRAGKLDPSLAEAFYYQGLIYDNVMHKKEKAVILYSQAIKKNPLLAVAYKKRGYIYWKKQETEKKAIVDFKQFLRLKPRSPEAKRLQQHIEQWQGNN